MNVTVCAGTRPNWIKAAELLKKRPEWVKYFTIDLGQHYSKSLTWDRVQADFVLHNKLKGLETHANDIIVTLSNLFRNSKPNYVIVFGDCVSTYAASVAAMEADVPVVHVEAGVRSYEEDLVEEKVRVAVDKISDVLCAPTEIARFRLEKEKLIGIRTGDVMYDRFLSVSPKEPQDIVLPREFILCTLHRSHLLNSPECLEKIMGLIVHVSKTILPVVLPAHPHLVEKAPDKYLREINCVRAVSYEHMRFLLERCSLVITDSGGLQKEAMWAMRPTITLRKATEWPETVFSGLNTLIDPESNLTIEQLRNVILAKLERCEPIDLSFEDWGAGKATENIWRALLK